LYLDYISNFRAFVFGSLSLYFNSQLRTNYTNPRHEWNVYWHLVIRFFFRSGILSFVFLSFRFFFRLSRKCLRTYSLVLGPFFSGSFANSVINRRNREFSSPTFSLLLCGWIPRSWSLVRFAFRNVWRLRAFWMVFIYNAGEVVLLFYITFFL